MLLSIISKVRRKIKPNKMNMQKKLVTMRILSFFKRHPHNKITIYSRRCPSRQLKVVNLVSQFVVLLTLRRQETVK